MNETLTVFELYIVEIFTEFLRQIYILSTSSIFLQNWSGIIPRTGIRWEGLNLSTYSRSLLKRKSMEKYLRKAFDWLHGIELIPKKIKTQLMACEMFYNKKVDYERFFRDHI